MRFVCGNYQREASVTAMREDICLPTLEDKRRQARLTIQLEVADSESRTVGFHTE